jgi:hypothetical protein
MSFFTIEPEASGAPDSEGSGEVVSCIFDTWLGDDLVRAYPAVLVTTPLREALLDLRQPTGFEITRARIRTSGFFRQQHPGVRLPPFWSIGVRGEPGRDDMGLTPAGTLVVSQSILDVLMDFRIGRAVLAQYAPGSRARRSQEEQ